jgi:hypothetical protein
MECFLAYRALNVGWEGVRLVVDLDFFLARAPGDRWSYYPQDEDSARASFKAGQDALQDVGWIKTDSAKHVRIGYTRLHRTAKQHGGRRGIVLTLTLWPEDIPKDYDSLFPVDDFLL